MTFDFKYFQPIGGQGGRGKAPQCFSYKTTDAPADVDTAGYFNPARNLLELGDVIDVAQVDSLAAPTSVVAAGRHVVVNKSAASVDVSDATVFAVKDTD